MAVKERVLLVCGPRDGEWFEVDAGAPMVELREAIPSDAALDTSEVPVAVPTLPTTIYLRCTLHLAIDEPVSFFRPAAITDRQALLWMMAGHGKAGAQ